MKDWQSLAHMDLDGKKRYVHKIHPVNSGCQIGIEKTLPVCPGGQIDVRNLGKRGLFMV
jgi:hypothetical protein